MVDAAARRNAAFVEEGKAEFLVAELEDLDLGDRRFDLIFALGWNSKTAPITNAFAALRNGRRTSPCRAPGR
jgi:hypothetical protein